MRLLRSILCVAVVIAAAAAAPAGAITLLASQQPTTPPGQEEFVPLSEIPPEEQIPAFTLVGIAYAAVWVVLIAYVWSVSKRLHAVETELASLSRKRN